MVFRGFRPVFEWIGKSRAFIIGAGNLFFMESSADGESNFRKRKRKESSASVSAFFTSGGSMDCDHIKKTHRYRASFTIEAAFVFGIVLMCICGLIGFAYKTHDTVTGKMILEEMLVQARRIEDRDELMERSEMKRLEIYGEELGNPRLWLGLYDLELDLRNNAAIGKASAGDWSQEMQMERFRPGNRLLNFEVLKELEKEWTNDESRIQAGDEP